MGDAGCLRGYRAARKKAAASAPRAPAARRAGGGAAENSSAAMTESAFYVILYYYSRPIVGTDFGGKSMQTVLCINDLSALGRCSLAVMTPVLSALGVQCCPLPTAVLSSHTGGFAPVVRKDETEFLKQSLAAYTAQEISFDAAATGYFASPEAALAAADWIKTGARIRLCDPVMADGGKLYTGFGEEMIEALREVCAVADVITPNLTESALLLGLDPAVQQLTEAELKERCLALAQRFHADVLLTGAALSDGRRVCGGVRHRWGEFFAMPCQYVDVSYPGTGDLFAAVMVGALLAGNELESAGQLALHFTQKCAHATFAKKTDPRFGVEFEALLPELEATLCR